MKVYVVMQFDEIHAIFDSEDKAKDRVVYLNPLPRVCYNQEATLEGEYEVE